jgi:hypothetical protein
MSFCLLSEDLNITIYKIIILPLVLYGCETWYFTLREGHRLRVFENRVLRRIFGPRRDEVTGEWRKLHNEELRDLYSSLSIIKIIKSMRMRWAGHVVRMEKRNVYRLVGKPEGRRPLGRPRHRRVDYIKMDRGAIVRGDVHWIGVTEDRDQWRALVNAVMNLRVVLLHCHGGRVLGPACSVTCCCYQCTSRACVPSFNERPSDNTGRVDLSFMPQHPWDRRLGGWTIWTSDTRGPVRSRQQAHLALWELVPGAGQGEEDTGRIKGWAGWPW